MESLGEQTELGTLLYPGEAQAPAALELGVHENLGEAAVHTFPSSQQTELPERAGLASEEEESGLPIGLGSGETALDETSQLSEARPNLEESGGAGALDIATRRSLLLGRIQKQRHLCHVCNRECPSKHKLKRHLSTHSEERPFNCHLCGKSFKWTEYLAKHMRQQHKGEALPPSLASEGTTTGMSGLQYQQPGDDLANATQLVPVDHGVDASTMDSSGMDASLDASVDMSVDTTCSGLVASSTVTGMSQTPVSDDTGFIDSIPNELTASTAIVSQTQVQTADPLMVPHPPTQPSSLPAPELVPVQPHVLNPDPSTTADIFSLPITEHTQRLMHHPDLQTASSIMANILPGTTQSQGVFAPSSYPPPLPSIPPAVVSLSHSLPPNPNPPHHHHPPPNPLSLPPYSMELMTSQPAGSLTVATPTEPATSIPVYSAIPTDMPIHPSVGVTSHDAFGIDVHPPPTTAYNIPEPGTLLNVQGIQAPIEETPPMTIAPPNGEPLPPALPSSQQPVATPSSPTVVVREDPPPAKRRKKETVSVGIQCEVGHETLIALFEEEEQARTQGIFEQTDLEINASALEIPHDRDKPVILRGAGYHEGARDGEEGCQVTDSECVHSPETPVDRVIHKYPCEHSGCTKAYVHRKDLIRHMKIRHGLSPQRLEPIAMETPEKPFICQVGGCDRSYFHMKDLRRHQRQCHQVSLSSDDTPEEIPIAEGEGRAMVRFPCDFPDCLRSYVHKKDLVRHKRLYHKDSTPRPSVPVPMRYTDADLKKLRQEEKLQRAANSHLNTSAFEKSRLDSIGSTVSNSGTEEPPNSATLVEGDQASELAQSLSIERMERLATSAVEEFHNPDSFIASSTISSAPVSQSDGMSQSSQYEAATTNTGVLSAETAPQGEQPAAIDRSQLSGSLQQLSTEEGGEVTGMNPEYGMDAFGGVAISDDTVHSYAEQVKNTFAGQDMQADSAPSSQYDPTSVLRSLAQATAGDAGNTPLHASIQNVVNQLLAGTTGAEDIGHTSF